MAVLGYIKNIQSLFPSNDPYYNIHDLIIQICTLYYAPIHEWDPEYISSKMQFHIETNSVRQDVIVDLAGSSFLKGVFDSGTHDWLFRIDVCKHISSWSPSATIGLYKTRFGEPPTEICYTRYDYNCGYGFAYNIGRLTDEAMGSSFQGRKYGQKAKSGDIVGMHCDMNKKELSFSINGVNHGIAYKNIENTEYKVAVKLYSHGDTVTLLD